MARKNSRKKNPIIQHSVGLGAKNVVISNAITQSAQGLSLGEKRILFAAIAKGGARGDLSSFVRLNVTEYAETFGLKPNQAYQQVKASAKSIWNRYITLREEKDAKGVLVTHFRWVDAYQYHDNLGYVTIGFSKHVIPHLIELQTTFTKYKLKQACALRSVYSWRFLELFEQQSNGWIIISIEDLYNTLDVKSSQRANFGKFRSQILEPSIKELSEKDGWLVKYVVVKEGRRVSSLKITFEKDKQTRFDFDSKPVLTRTERR